MRIFLAIVASVVTFFGSFIGLMALFYDPNRYAQSPAPILLAGFIASAVFILISKWENVKKNW